MPNPSGAMARFIVFGKVGSGKSTLCNMLYAGHPDPVGGFRTSDSVRGVTSAVEEKRGRGYLAVDTIGMGEAEHGTVPHEEAKKKLKEFLKKTRNEYMYIIFVAKKGRFTEEEMVYWEIFKEIFKGGEDNFVVVFTNANQKWIEQSRGEFRKGFTIDKRTFNRFIGVDFPPVPEDDEDDRDEIEALNTGKRDRSLKHLEDSLRGYSFGPVQPDTNFMNETQLDQHAETLMSKIKAVITHIYSSASRACSSEKVTAIFGRIFRLLFF